MQFPVKPIAYKRAHEQISEQLLELIRSGKLNPGQQLPSERDLCKIFDVSRPTVREALTVLEVAGIVEMRPGRGAYVTAKTVPFTQGVLQVDSGVAPSDLLELRMIIEPEAARLAALRANDDSLRALEESLAACDEAGRTGYELFEPRDVDFHMAIAAMTDNPLLVRIQEEISEMRMGRLWRLIKLRLASTPADLGTYSSEHRAMFDAIRARDAHAAAEAARSHLENVRTAMLGTDEEPTEAT